MQFDHLEARILDLCLNSIYLTLFEYSIKEVFAEITLKVRKTYIQSSQFSKSTTLRKNKNLCFMY